jgi:membrane-bound serine protease (ClpP class)
MILAAALAGVLGIGPAAAGRAGNAPAEPRADEVDVPAGARMTEQGWFAPKRYARPKPELPRQVTKAFVIPIRGEINNGMYEALRLKAIRCRSAGAELVIFDMDTLGGLVGAAINITRLIKQDLRDIYTVCFVRTKAISAGAMIAVACDEIIMTPVASLGDCAPLIPGGKLEGVEREKSESFIRTEFVQSAELNGYSEALAQCMVSWDLEAWLIRNKKTRQLRYVLRNEWQGRVDIPKGVATGPAVPEADWELLRVVVPEGRLLTMTSTQAEEYGLAAELLDAPAGRPYEELRRRYNVTEPPVVLEMTWSERMVAFLTTPTVLGILMTIGMLCIYMEISSPGFGIPGAIGIACFALLFGSRFLVGLANWWEIAMFLLGIVLLGVEVFVTPGFGVAGIGGILCMLIALVAMLVPNAPDELPIPQVEMDWTLLEHGVLTLFASILLAIFGAALLARHLHRVPVAGKLILTGPKIEPEASGPSTEDAPIRHIRPGDIGVVHNICRPVGVVRFGEDLVDAVTDGQFIPAGKSVKVLKNEGNRVLVTPEE